MTDVHPGRGVIAISSDLIREALHMPQTVEIVDAGMSDDGRYIEVLVESPDLTNDGLVPTLSPTVTRVPERFEWSWNLPTDD